MSENAAAGTNPPPVAAPAVNRTWDVLCHLLALALFVGIPFGNIIGPLVVWLIKRSELPSVDEHGKESLNFQISMTIYAIIAGFSILVLVGFIVLPLVLLTDLVLVIIASIKASDGVVYRYPLTIRFIT